MGEKQAIGFQADELRALSLSAELLIPNVTMCVCNSTTRDLPDTLLSKLWLWVPTVLYLYGVRTLVTAATYIFSKFIVHRELPSVTN